MEKPIGKIYPPELHFRYLVFAMSIVAIGMSFVLTVGADGRVYPPLATVPLPDACVSHRLFGVDCPGCGMSRAFISISAGDWDAAHRFNAASYVMYLFVAVQIPWQGMQIVRTLKRGRPIDTWWTLVPMIGVIAWLVGCYLRRLV